MNKWQAIDQQKDEDKFYNNFELFDNVFFECDNCNRGEVTLLFDRYSCEHCEGRGYNLFDSIAFQRRSVEYFNTIWKSNKNTSPVTEIVQNCNIEAVVTTSYLFLKEKHLDNTLTKRYKEPIGYKHVMSSVIVLEEDRDLVQQNSLSELMFNLIYHVES